MQPLLNIFRQSSSTTKAPKIDFLALEAKWQAKWTTSEGKIKDCGIWDRGYHPLVPLYHKHLRTPTILDALAWCTTTEASTAASRDSNGSLLNRILELAKLGRFDRPSGLPDNTCMDMETCIAKYGTDVTRTYVVFRKQLVGNHWCYENDVIQIQQWLQSIREATLLANESYAFTQKSTPQSPSIPEALSEPDLDTWLELNTDTPRSWVHIPPKHPNIFDSSMEEPDCTLWHAAQDALLSWTQQIGRRNSLQNVESRLVALTKAIIAYGGERRKLPDVHYHATRILLCLIAPFAPAFAEECWVSLHYGSGTPSVDECDIGLEEDLVEDKITEEELAEDKEPRDLPRQ
ncbi:hypothetical protein HYALB_00001019 [Hymenoscyphus albidus]|uniref:Uncharacterized protein n=1 Tax=Hymenoscyphus albidus TaxID=595503 RepID=A0A9N9Q1S4_9HELO|nr:hypothetical protein HYALB_00001019 [Hymenoscyphus albidus]